jgi:HPt (histidine-containing phosphotransfer) domain-containing protein
MRRITSEDDSKHESPGIQSSDLPNELPGIDIVSGLHRIGGNRKLYKKLLMDFAKSYSSVSEEINDLLKSNDLQTVERIAHTVKGIAGNLSAHDIRESASQLESALADKTGDYQKLLLALDNALKPVMEAISALAHTEDKEPLIKDKPVDPLVVRPILIDIACLLRKSDPDAEKCMEVLKENIGGSMFQNEMEAMEKHIGNFDFDLALISVAKIAKALNISLES